MNDFYHAFSPAEARPRRRFVLALDSRPPARPRLAVQVAASQAQAGARGEIACRAAWLHVRALGPDGLLALPRDAGARAMHVGGMPPLGAIAAEVEHALAHGVRTGTARALVLLAALADAGFDGA